MIDGSPRCESCYWHQQEGLGLVGDKRRLATLLPFILTSSTSSFLWLLCVFVLTVRRRVSFLLSSSFPRHSTE